jgi:hypothetical protein
MKSVMRPSAPRGFSRTILLPAAIAFALFASAGVATAPPSSGPQSASDQGAIAGFRPETRLRKLHLVRPDLIPYPIAYEVYC